jgi:uncharacterized protein (TIRG00374 family)
MGIFFAWLALKDVTKKDEADIKDALQKANYWWIALSMWLGVLSHISRAMRWKLLLSPLGYKPKTSNTFYSVMAGYLANFAVQRLGEFVRCGLLRQYEKIPFPQSFGTVISERVIDLFTLLLIFVITVLIEFDRIWSYTVEKITHRLQHYADNSLLLIIAAGVGISIVIIFFLFRKKLYASALFMKVKEVFSNFWQGFLIVRKVEKPFLFIAHSLFIWLMYYLMLFVCFFAFNGALPADEGLALVILTFGSVGIIFAPGGIGFYQWIVLQIIILYYGIEYKSLGVAFGWIAWLAQFALVLVLGGISFILLPVSNKEK